MTRDSTEVQSSSPVLVTGASSGIGRSIVERLSCDGHFVYAGARKPEDLRALGLLKNVHPVQLDITSAEQVGAAVELVQRGGRGLYGLVNNAGIATAGPILNGDDEELALVLNVNVRGTYRVTQAFAQLIIAGRGRIVTIGSIAGTLANRNLSAYSMSKHALEAFVDSLAAEVECCGIGVSLIEPGAFKTQLALNARARLGVHTPMPDLSRSSPPQGVAAAVVRALFDPAPRRRYLVVNNEEEARRTIQRQITRLVELNATHAFSFDRFRLMQLLDQELLACGGDRVVRLRGQGVADDPRELSP